MVEFADYLPVVLQGLFAALMGLLIFVLRGFRQSIDSTRTSVRGIESTDRTMGRDLADLRVEIATTYVTRSELANAHRDMRMEMAEHHREILEELRHIRVSLAEKADK